MFNNIMYFEVAEEEKASFFEANEKSWPEFFGASGAYRGTEIVEVGAGEYITVDTWDNLESFLFYAGANKERFLELDERYSFSKELTVCALGDRQHYTHEEIDAVVADLFGDKV